MDPRINLDVVNALPILLPNHDQVNLIMVGCGGTGSWLAPSVVRIARLLQELNQKVSITFIDFDRVEPKNIPRQNFIDADVGLNKAETLALRYGACWGLEIKAIPHAFEPAILHHRYHDLSVIIGCVDRASGRRSISSMFKNYSTGYGSSHGQYRWWLDCGNAETSGQVLLGCCNNRIEIERGMAYPPDKRKKNASPMFVSALPTPGAQHPELLEERASEVENNPQSCAEIALTNAQALTINQRVAIEAATMLNDLLLVRQLKIFAAYFDIKARSASARYITPQNILSFFPK